MNSRLNSLNTYPFQKLNNLLSSLKHNGHYNLINLSIGEPKHCLPIEAINGVIFNLNGMSLYPKNSMELRLRSNIAHWLSKRYIIPALDPITQVMPVLGSREAIFSIIQTIINPQSNSLVVFQNPFYQIYEGAATLAGAHTYFINFNSHRKEKFDWKSVPEQVWFKTSILLVCTPHNPTGYSLSLHDWKVLFSLSKEFGFVIVSDECYSEIYHDVKPIGLLEAAKTLGYDDSYRNMICINSLSKRSSVPGLRSGFIAGDQEILGKFAIYRTYSGSAMSSMTMAASTLLWKNEKHVILNRKLYADKLLMSCMRLKKIIPCNIPQGTFYLWLQVPDDDQKFTCKLYLEKHVIVLPGTFLSRSSNGDNPGKNFIRISLTESIETCQDAVERIFEFIKKNYH